MKRILISFFSLLCLLLPTLAMAQSPASVEQLNQANQLYENSQFSEAAAMYESLVEQGYADGILFYNLGNAYFKQEDWGNAILNYRRAQRLMPRDDDIRANLTLARLQTKDQIELDSQAFVTELFRFPERWLTLNEMAVGTLTLWFALIIVAIVFAQTGSQHWKQWLSYLLIVIAIMLALGVASLAARLYVESTSPDGVVIANEVKVMSGPGSQYVVEFSLNTGAEISVLEQRPNWTRITLPGGQLQGWIESSQVVTISSS